MVINASDFPLTAAHSPHISVVESTGSTNADLLAHGVDADTWPHLSVLITDDQRSGRGRLDRSWQAPAGASLALSVLLRTSEVPEPARSWVPLIAGLAMTESIAAQLGSGVSSKWPNDVLVGDQKICGILAEMSPTGDAIIVGSGVNTTMTADQAPVETATSFAMHDRSAHLDLLVSHYIGRVAAELQSLREHEGDAVRSGLRDRFAAVCSTIGKVVTIHLPGGASYTGDATGIDDDGRLLVLVDGESRTVSAGDVVHVR